MILRASKVTGVHYQKLRAHAIETLHRCAQLGKSKLPHYDHQMSDSRRKPGHVYQCRFHIPQFVFDAVNKKPMNGCLTGAGNDLDEDLAKQLAALDTCFKLEDYLKRRLGGILDQYEKEQKQLLENIPLKQERPGVSWLNLPMDYSFARQRPASRFERLEFGPSLREQTTAYLTARAITLASKKTLPRIVYKKNKDTHKLSHCNVKTNSQRMGTMSVRGPGRKKPFRDSMIPELRKSLALEDSLKRIHEQMLLEQETKMIKILENTSISPSFGTAKLFVQLPDHQYQPIYNLLRHVEKNPLPHPEKSAPRTPLSSPTTTKTNPSGNFERNILRSRIEAFRRHQSSNPLPVDDIENHIPHEAPVTLIQGGTGSGKTTRYPLMLSLFAKSSNTKVMVAQPRRLACVAAADRVLMEQGFAGIGTGKKHDSYRPIGYAIRFESHLASASERTVDFATPGVLLRRAMADPLMEDISHLVIDEVHERNADIDLLISLAKRAVKTRLDHPTLRPLRLVLMSATVDTAVWGRYFKKDGLTMSIVNVPGRRAFPIDIVHLGDKKFPYDPKRLRSLNYLERSKHDETKDLDKALCVSTSELVLHLFEKDVSLKKGGTVLCFLPGMEEIRMVDNLLRRLLRTGQKKFDVRYLHSAISAQQQQQVFEPGPKVVLSTNIAETSLTIADVKYVIDAGRERQHAMLTSTYASASTTVVGSQLATVNISQAAANQRAGRAGRVAAGTCYRLYTKKDYDESPPHTTPEILRMELSQLVLHALSFATDQGGHPLELLLGAPDPPAINDLRQALTGLKQQGLVETEIYNENNTCLTGLGRAVSEVPASPRIGRMLFMGLVLRAIEPALIIASILSVPKILRSEYIEKEVIPKSTHSSDIVLIMEEYQKYIAQGGKRHSEAALFDQISRVRNQLEQHMFQFIKRKASVSTVQSKMDPTLWNENSHRMAAQVGLVCSATPHIAHLVRNDNSFATRDIVDDARMHPSSINFSGDRRVPWYCYHELRATTKPYLIATTAVSPLDLALFSDASIGKVDENSWNTEKSINISDDEWLYLVDQWVPVAVPEPLHRAPVAKLQKMLSKVMLEQVALDPASVLESKDYAEIVLFALSAIEQQRISSGDPTNPIIESDIGAHEDESDNYDE